MMAATFSPYACKFPPATSSTPAFVPSAIIVSPSVYSMVLPSIIFLQFRVREALCDAPVHHLG